MIELGDLERSSMSARSRTIGAVFASGFSITLIRCGVSSRIIPVTVLPDLVTKMCV